MKATFSDSLRWGTLVLAVVAFLYLGGYLLSVGKSVSTSASSPTPQGSRTLHVVSPTLAAGWKYELFSPALKLDRELVRRRYWSSWYVVITATGTNLDYDCDRMRR